MLSVNDIDLFHLYLIEKSCRGTGSQLHTSQTVPLQSESIFHRNPSFFSKNKTRLILTGGSLEKNCTDNLGQSTLVDLHGYIQCIIVSVYSTFPPDHGLLLYWNPSSNVRASIICPVLFDSLQTDISILGIYFLWTTHHSSTALFYTPAL